MEEEKPKKNEEIVIINKTPDDLTIEELLELAELFQEFLIVSDLRTKIANRFLSQGETVKVYDFIPDILQSLKNPEARKAFEKIVQFIIAQDLPHVAGKHLLDLYKTTINFINELDIMGFFSQASTVLTRLIRE
jgi:hypothetical protein